MTSLTTTQLLEGQSWYAYCARIDDDISMDTNTFAELVAMKPKERGKVKIFGKEMNVPRWQQTYGQDYYFSGLNHKALPIEHSYLQKLLKWVCNHSGKHYSQILINWYMNGDEYISDHSDDESQLVPGSVIYSFSFGSTRTFTITSKQNKNEKISLSLCNNSLVVMGGQMQTFYKHGVPKTKVLVGPRINITIRLYK